MNTFKVAGLVIGAAIMLSPFVASAATVSSQAVFANGQTKVYGNAGQSVQTAFQVHVNSGEVLNAIRTKVDSQATVCTPVGPYEGDQTVTVNTNIMLPPNSNSSGYNLVTDLFTTDTLPQAQAMTDPNLACSSAGPGAHIFANAYSGSGVVNVIPSSGGSTSVGDAGAPPSWFQSWLNTWNMQQCVQGGGSWSGSVCTPKSTPTPTVDPICVEFQGDVTGLYQGTQDPAGSLGRVGTLQSFLMSKGFDISLLRQNLAKYGYYGPQTAAAVQAFHNAHPTCN